MKSLPDVTFLEFDQCVLGQTAKKPTGLLLLRMRSVHAAIRAQGHAGKCSCPRGAHRQAYGYDSVNKEFHTAKLKIYPEQMCAVLDEAWLEDIGLIRPSGTLPRTELPAELQSFFVTELQQVERVQPDYFRSTVGVLSQDTDALYGVDV